MNGNNNNGFKVPSVVRKNLVFNNFIASSNGSETPSTLDRNSTISSINGNGSLPNILPNENNEKNGISNNGISKIEENEENGHNIYVNSNNMENFPGLGSSVFKTSNPKPGKVGPNNKMPPAWKKSRKQAGGSRKNKASRKPSRKNKKGKASRKGKKPSRKGKKASRKGKKASRKGKNRK